MAVYTTTAPSSSKLSVSHSAEVAPTSARPDCLSAPVTTQRAPVTDRMVETVLTLTVVHLEEKLIPAQGAGDILFVYAKDSEIMHNVRRTLEIFDGDMGDAIDNICTFVIEEVVEEC